MKKIFLLVFALVSIIYAKSQDVSSSVSSVDAVSKLSSYFGGNKIIYVRDTAAGGYFYLYQGSSPVDNVNIFAGANSSKWRRAKQVGPAINTGFKLVNPGTQDVKNLIVDPFGWITLDSIATANAITLKLDSGRLAKYNRDHPIGVGLRPTGPLKAVAGATNIDSLLFLKDSSGLVSDLTVTGNTLYKVINGVSTAVGSLTGSSVYIEVGPAYGIVADGVTDNATSLMNMRTALQGLNKPNYVLIFPAGTVIYSNNRWLVGVVNFDIWGAGTGTIFRSIYAGSDEKFQRAIWQPDIWQENVLTYTGTIVWTTSYKRFNNTTAGSTRIQLKTAGDTTLFPPGSRILLGAEEQIGNGFPPGTFKNEWNVVDSNNIGSGYIAFKKALRFDYDTTTFDLPDVLGTGQGSGKPRITKLDRVGTYLYPQHSGFHNITFGGPVGGGTGSAGTCQPVASDVVLEDVIIEGFYSPSQSEHITARRIRQIGDPALYHVEYDKVVGTVETYDSYFKCSVSNASGVENAFFYKTQFDNSVRISARNNLFENCTFLADRIPSLFDPGIGGYPAAYPIYSFIVRNCKFGRTPYNTSEQAINIAPRSSFTVGAVSGTTIYLPFGASQDANALAFYAASVGTKMYKAGGTKYGIVTKKGFDATYNSGQGAWTLAGTWITPTVGETWKFSYIQNFIDDGLNTVIAPYKSKFPRYGDALMLRANKGGAGDVILIKLGIKDFDITGADHVYDLSGKIISAEINVTKAYSGTDTGCKLYFLEPSGSDVFTINLMTTGRRLIDFTAQGSKTGDALDASKLDTWFDDIHFFLRGASGNLSDQSETSLPIFELTIKIAR